MRLFPLLVATIEQVAAYAHHFARTRYPGAAVLAVLFAVFGIALALAIDLVRLPFRIDEARTGRRRAAAHRRRDPFRPT